MRLFYLTTACLFLSILSDGQVQINLFGGPQFSKASYKVNDSKQKTSFKPGIQAGIGLKIPFENRIYFAPSVFYSHKGYKVNFNKHVFPPDPDASDNNVTMHTMEFAPMLQIDLSDQPDHFYISFGPSLDIQIYGREKFHLLNTGESVNKNIVFGFEEYGRYSIAAIGRVGYESKNGMIIFAQYNLGLGSINNADYGPNILHRVFGISVGKYLNRK